MDESHTWFWWSSMEVPDSSSLLASHRVVCPVGSGGGNSASEHILTRKRQFSSQVTMLGGDFMFSSRGQYKMGKREALEAPRCQMLKVSHPSALTLTLFQKLFFTSRYKIYQTWYRVLNSVTWFVSNQQNQGTCHAGLFFIRHRFLI